MPALAAGRFRFLAVPLRPHVLVIDDDADIRSLLRKWLCKAGFSVAEVGDGPSALKLIETVHFDLLITDLCLPSTMNGVETVRRAMEHDPNLRSLFTSASEQPGSYSDHDDFISKPFNERELIGCVWELICRGERRSAAPASPRPKHPLGISG